MDIKTLINEYARLYKDFEEKQDGKILPGGDQKTGVIAEYYAKCYIEKVIGVEAVYANAGKSYDLHYTFNDIKFKVQVKAVSAHSKTRIIAPLNLTKNENNNTFDYLYLISLDENFKPDGFYINTYESIIKKLEKKNDTRTKIQGATMQGKNKNGYWLFDFGNNEKDKLNDAIDH